jgi:tripartite-type tricarboxylate transporter receptor subunit TctC
MMGPFEPVQTQDREPPMKTVCTAAPAFALAALLAASAHAEDFYKGKTLTLVVGYATSGAYDLNARLIARHLSRFIPGNPTVVVSNMPGAGSLRSVQYIQRIAPKDGTVLEMFDFTQITNSLLTPENVPIDFRAFKWIGSVARDVAVCYAWHNVNAKTLADMQRLPVIYMGRTNPGTSSDIEQKILRKLFKVNVHSVAGYNGSAEAFIAVERGELNGGCTTWASLPPSWISGQKIRPVLRITEATVLDLPSSVPSAHDLLKDERDRKILRVLTAAGELGKPLVLNEQVPDERVQILRKAFGEMVKDKAFLADAEKMRQVVSPTIGDATVKILDGIYSSPPDIVQAARAIASE